MEETVLFHVVQPEDCDNTHETISSYNVFVVYSFICWSSIIDLDALQQYSALLPRADKVHCYHYLFIYLFIYLFVY